MVFACDKSVETFERKSQMGTALVVGYRVNFVDDDGLNTTKMLPALAGGEKDIKRFGCSDENVRRVAEHGSAFFWKRVACADTGADLWTKVPALHCQLLDLGEGCIEIFLDVVREGLERANVENLRAGRQAA
jgi:hypothetical protein